MSLGKEASVQKRLSWPSASPWGRVSRVLGACGLPRAYGDAQKATAGLLHLFQEQRGAPWDKGKKQVGWTDCGQWEAKAQRRKWEEELRLEKVKGGPLLC